MCVKIGLKLLLAVFAAWAIGGCSKEASQDKSLVIKSMRFEQATYALSPGQHVEPLIYMLLEGIDGEVQYDNAQNPFGFVWSIDKPAVAVVSKVGVVTCLAYGTAVLTVEAPGSGLVVTTQIDAPLVLESMRFEQARYNVSGASVQPRIFIRTSGQTEESAYDAVGNSHKVVWRVGDPAVATVSAAGMVTRLKNGTTTLTARSPYYSEEISTELSFDSKWYGEWVLETWDAAATLAGKVYLSLDEAGAFALYQNINAQGFVRYKGTFQVVDLSGKLTLTGTYSDGVPWAGGYELSVVADEMTLTALTDGVISVYRRTTIPDYVKEGITGKRLHVAGKSGRFL